jgi:hypothetical protein
VKNVKGPRACVRACVRAPEPTAGCRHPRKVADKTCCDALPRLTTNVLIQPLVHLFTYTATMEQRIMCRAELPDFGFSRSEAAIARRPG